MHGKFSHYEPSSKSSTNYTKVPNYTTKAPNYILEWDWTKTIRKKGILSLSLAQGINITVVFSSQLVLHAFYTCISLLLYLNGSNKWDMDGADLPAENLTYTDNRKFENFENLWKRVSVGGEVTFQNAWGENFLGRNWKFLVLPGGGTDPGGHYAHWN